MEQKWKHLLRRYGALWLYEGTFRGEPHAKLTSGKHSNGFVNMTELLQYPNLIEEAARDLIDLKDPTCFASPPDWCVGSAFGGITLSHECARQLGKKTAFAEPVRISPESTALQVKRFDVNRGERAVMIDDVFTTGKSIDQVMCRLEERHAIVLPFIFVIVNRSFKTHHEGREIVSLTTLEDVEIRTWDPKECPLCKAGSQAFRPKKEWKKFVS